jgi:hypothetical protein
VRTFVSAAVAAALLSLSTPAGAQIPWDTPRLVGPESPGGFAVYWLRSSALTVETDAAMATWALPGMGGAVIVRGGAGVDDDDDLSVFGGIDLRAPIARHTAELPLDLEWSAGLGAGSRTGDGRYLVVTLPMAVSAGRSWSSGSIWLAPYVAMGVALDLKIGEDAPDEEFEATPVADLGLDFALDPDRRFIFRTAVSLGDRQALVVGLAVGGAR